jgi:hypothetical protein
LPPFNPPVRPLTWAALSAGSSSVACLTSLAASWLRSATRGIVAPDTAKAIRLSDVLTAFGAVAVTFMMLMYAVERRHRGFVLAFACGCALSSVYGFLAGTWPFGVVEAIWSLIALRRYIGLRRDSN